MDQKKIGVIVVGMLVCVLAGAGIEHVRQVLTTVPAEPDPAETLVRKPRAPIAPRTIVVKDEEALRTAEALRRRVAELEKALADSHAARAQEPPKPTVVQPERPSRQSFADRMEQMKKDNPDQYAEMQKRREDFRQSMEQRAQDRADFISAVDTRNMNEVQKENHEKLVATVARVNELMEQMNQPGVDRTQEMRQQMGDAIASLGDLYSAERTYLLEETAKAVGYQGSQAVEFAGQMQSIIDNTTMPNNFGRRGGRGGPPPGAK